MRTFRKLIFWVIGVGIALILLIQLVPYGRAHQNPPVLAEPAWDSPQTRALFMRVCGDCHSNETAWPWYSKIAPVSWLVQRDVEEGREKFNVSEWGSGKNEGDEAYEQYQSGEMPLPIYLIMHPEARLNDAEREQLLNGLKATFGAEGNEFGED